MNILDSAYLVGQQMKNISIGREWNDLYAQLSESISPEAWDIFLKTSSRGFMHYYSFPNARAVIENNSKRNDIPEILNVQLKELEASDTLKRICELSVILGNNLNELTTGVMTPYPIPKDFGQLKASAKLTRSIQDLHLSFQRSGILKSILKYVDPKTKESPGLVNVFNQEKSSYMNPMDPGIRKVVRKLGATEQQEMLMVFYISDLVLELTRQMVFESHLNQVADIMSESIVRSVVKNVRGIRTILLYLDGRMLSQMNRTGPFVRVQLASSTQTAIMTRRRMRFGQDVPEGLRMTMNGYLYLESDVNLIDQLIK